MPTNVEESLQLIIDTSTLTPVVSPYLHKVMPHITQKFIRMRKSQRPIELLNLVKKDVDKKRPVIVFSNRKATTDYVSIFLNDHGIETVSMNNLAIEKIRRQQFKKFQTGQVNVLSTTGNSWTEDCTFSAFSSTEWNLLWLLSFQILQVVASTQKG